MPKENLFIAENQDLDVDEQKKNDILSFIESCNNFQDLIKKLEEENLIWYFIGPLRKDEDIKEQINLKWKEEFHKFEQLINETHKKFEESLPGENFLVYTTKDNDFKIRFENKEKPIEISALLRASDEDKVYNLSLGKDSHITATKKGSERHYDFTGSSSCEMTINWQAKDSKGNNINCSMTVKIDSSGIKNVVDESKFGGITDPEEVLKLIEQNKEVFINGKTLHQAFTDMGKSMNEQQTPAEEAFTKDSSQSPILSSSGYSSLSTPSSHRSSLSTSSEFDGEDEVFESDTFSDVEESKQEGEELKDRVAALEKENTHLKRKNAELKSLNTGITEEGDEELSKLTEGKQDLAKEVTRLKVELEKKVKELAEKDKDIERLAQKVTVLEQSQKDKNARITDLINQLKDKEDEVQSVNGINKELQKKLDQVESELSKLKEENTELRNDIKKTLEEGSKDNHEKQLVEQLTEEKEKNNTLAKEMNQLSKELNELQREKEDLERKIRQLEPERSLADEMSEVNAKVAISTQTEVEYENRRIQASDHETTVPKTQDQGTQAKNAGVDASSSTDQKETKEMEIQTDVKMSDFRNVYDEEGKYIRTELSDPSAASAQASEKSTPSKR
ncbi:hypothetical protein WSTR_04005 [Wolbachia endosymbiont of Laodelphax striatellus]|uniref:hypothetical protein n=1 Tax=Wolbachia endosymbiont of Laodelphax striatellus TaxID=368602 RepID=UPI0007C59BB8|nr:hypothetical protein [Wolbachia endosymbiont of Laodelphax striatellus]OAB81675.1 hypothetical protein WSTR_04005 [Wolbachia endosymbiont of Laodelphax striatellus]